MRNLAAACDYLDEADARLAMLHDLCGLINGEMTLSEPGMLGLNAVLRDIMGRIGDARQVIDMHRDPVTP